LQWLKDKGKRNKKKGKAFGKDFERFFYTKMCWVMRFLIAFLLLTKPEVKNFHTHNKKHLSFLKCFLLSEKRDSPPAYRLVGRKLATPTLTRPEI
jgi:hypothetical protein